MNSSNSSFIKNTDFEKFLDSIIQNPVQGTPSKEEKHAADSDTHKKSEPTTHFATSSNQKKQRQLELVSYIGETTIAPTVRRKMNNGNFFG